jgi:hypothetical protein
MILESVVGLSGHRHGSVLWSNAGDELLFLSNNAVVAMSVASPDAADGASCGAVTPRQRPSPPCASSLCPVPWRRSRTHAFPVFFPPVVSRMCAVLN